MKLFAALAFAAALPGAALAQTGLVEEPVGPSEFRQYAEGWTLYFDLDGKPFGAETFEPGGKTRWRYEDGTCVDGNWRAHGAQLCFLYDAEGVNREILCWRVLRTHQGGLIARLLNGPEAGLELTITKREKTAPQCGVPGTKT